MSSLTCSPAQKLYITYQTFHSTMPTCGPSWRPAVSLSPRWPLTPWCVSSQLQDTLKCEVHNRFFKLSIKTIYEISQIVSYTWDHIFEYIEINDMLFIPKDGSGVTSTCCFLQRAWVQFPVPTSYSSKLSVTLISRDFIPASDIHRHLHSCGTQKHIPTYI